MSIESYMTFNDELGHSFSEVYAHDDDSIPCDNCGCLQGDKEAQRVCPKSSAGIQLAEVNKLVKVLEGLVGTAMVIVKHYLNEIGGCEHDLNVCSCSEIEFLDAAKAALPDKPKDLHPNKRLPCCGSLETSGHNPRCPDKDGG